MRQLSRKSILRNSIFSIAASFLLLLVNCAPVSVKKEQSAFDFHRNEKNIQSLKSLNIKSNISINTPDSDGKLYANFDFYFPDSLKIQFRDPLGRKQALMRFCGEEFELWLQRENQRFGRNEIPKDFSLFVFEELELKEIRDLFLGRPLFKIYSGKKRKWANPMKISKNSEISILTHLNSDNTIRRVEIMKNNEISTIVVYTQWSRVDDIFLPENLQIIDLNRSIELQIKLYHFSPEYINLTGL